MGLPMVQVVMIMARQMSKPVADLVMRYGKNHPLFRNKILIPVGRGLVNLSTRLRMKNLGLGKPTSVAQVSEGAALEQASEFVQQVVIFGYSLSVFYAYQVYTKKHDVRSVTVDDIDQVREELNTRVRELSDQITQLNAEIRQLAEAKHSHWSVWSYFFGKPPQPAPPQPQKIERRHSEQTTSTISRHEAMQRISRPLSSSTVLNTLGDGGD